MSQIYDLSDFRRKVKESAPKDIRYVLISVDTDGEDGSVEHSRGLNEYEILGIMEWAKMLILATCKQPGGE